jgi:hypothetical protein
MSQIESRESMVPNLRRSSSAFADDPVSTAIADFHRNRA